MAMHSEHSHKAACGRSLAFSARELQCFQLAAEGRDFLEISDFTGLSPEEAEGLVLGIESRLGAHNRVHAVSLAMKMQLLDD